MSNTRYNINGNLAGQLGNDYSQLPEAMVKILCNQRGFVGKYDVGECMMLLGVSDIGAIIAQMDIQRSIRGVMFHASHPATPLTNPLRPIAISSTTPRTPSVTPPPGTTYFIWAPDPKKQANGKQILLIEGGTYIEYYSQSVKYLKELSKNRGLRYVNKQWNSLLLSLCAQGKLHRAGRFNVYMAGEFDDEQMNSAEKEIFVIYSDKKETDPQIGWDQIGKSLIGVVRKICTRLPPGESPYADLEIIDDGQPDGEYPEYDNGSDHGFDDGEIPVPHGRGV